MIITKIGPKKIISYQPHKHGAYTSATNVYEYNNKRLEVNTILKNDKKLVQKKTLSEQGLILKEKVIRFSDGIKNKVLNLK